MNPLSNINDEFARYFRDKGLIVTWDFSKHSGLHWYEIYDGDTLLCQVDFDAPLAEFLTDLPLFASGRERGLGPTQYEIRCDDTRKLQRLLKPAEPKVAP